MMDTDEQIQEVISWILKSGTKLCYADISQLAKNVVTALIPPPACGVSHRRRVSIVCDRLAGHVIEMHSNREHQVEWSDDGWTIHADLGEVELISEPDDPEGSDGDPTLARDMVRALLITRRALAAVDEKYGSDSQRITAPLVRSVRSAMHTADLVMDAAGAAVGQEYVTP